MHIWRIDLDPQYQNLDDYKTILTETEIETAYRFVQEIHQQRYIISRAALKIILAKYTDQEPLSIIFINNEFGKPHLVEQKSPPIFFNITHSQNLMFCIVTQEGEVGIDIEFKKSNIDVEGLAQRFFSTHEYQSLMNYPEKERKNAFYRLWVRKEAFIKAIGRGLHYSLKNFDVDASSANNNHLLKINDPSLSITDWQLHTFIDEPDYSGAWSINSKKDIKINCWQFNSLFLKD